MSELDKDKIPSDVLMVPGNLVIQCQPAVIMAAHEDDKDGENALPTFSMVAYTGGEMVVPNFSYPVVVKLSGIKTPAENIPVRFQHNALSGVGHTTKIKVVEGELIVEGVISRATDEAREIVASAGNGFPWQASIGVSSGEVEFIPDDVSVKVNGATFNGPIYVLTKSLLGEVSFVDMGADVNTSATIKAQCAEENGMPDMKKLTDDKDKTQSTSGDSEGKAVESGAHDVTSVVEAAAAPKLAPDAEKGDAVKAPNLIVASAPDGDSVVLKASRKSAADEVVRVDAVTKICASSDDAKLTAQAIQEGWSTERTELHVLRAGNLPGKERAKVANIHVHEGGMGDDATAILECAVTMAGNREMAEAEYKNKEALLDAASSRFPRGIGLQQLLFEAAAANGFAGGSYGGNLDIQRAAFGQGGLQASFSSVDISGILSNIANKFMLAGFENVEQVWKIIASLRSVKDFKQVTSYRLVGDETYELVGPGGEIKHGDLKEQTFTNQADTYAKMIGISRTDLINDDLGALTNVPRKLGRGAALKLNQIFWTAFLADSSHFTAGENNLLTGGGSALDLDALSTAEQTFMDQVDTESNPLGVLPKTMLVPTSLSVTAATLFRSAEIRDTTASTKIPVGNPHQGKFSPAVSAYLGNSTISGNSQTGWYLLADPEDMPTIEVAFLNGQQSPIIETVDANFNTLGILMRGYHDFGVALQDPKGGVKSDGV